MQAYGQGKICRRAENERNTKALFNSKVLPEQCTLVKRMHSVPGVYPRTLDPEVAG